MGMVDNWPSQPAARLANSSSLSACWPDNIKRLIIINAIPSGPVGT
jgi:hypothetical protein